VQLLALEGAAYHSAYPRPTGRWPTFEGGVSLKPPPFESIYSLKKKMDSVTNKSKTTARSVGENRSRWLVASR
jgi:hypothetical protein